MFWLLNQPRDSWVMAFARSRRISLLVLLTVQVLLQGTLYTTGVAMSTPDLSNASSDLSSTLPDGAILAGRLAGTLALTGSFQALPLLEDVEDLNAHESERGRTSLGDSSRG